MYLLKIFQPEYCRQNQGECYIKSTPAPTTQSTTTVSGFSNKLIPCYTAYVLIFAVVSLFWY